MKPTSDLEAQLVGISPEHRAVIEAARYQDIHSELVEATKRGEWTILDFWDSLPWLKGPGDWGPWRSFVASVFGLPLTPSELELYRKCTGRKRPPTEQAREAWAVVGRRARKSATFAVIASFVGAYWDHASYTAPGEPARIPILAKDKDEAKTIKGFIDTIFRTTPLACLLTKNGRSDEPAETVTLTTGCVIQIKAATITAGRSKAIPLAILDEIAFFRTGDSANPDTEILRGIRPAQATVPNALLIAASSPYARRGELYSVHQEHFGKEGSRVMVWQAATLTMHPGNPTVAAHVAEETAKDPLSAKAEYGAEFRTDVQQFVPDEIINAATDDVEERAPVPGVQYVAFSDPSGGTSDSMTLAVAHYEHPNEEHTGRAVLDHISERQAPFDPEDVVNEHAAVLRRYGITKVEGDRYAGEWPSSRYQKAKVPDVKDGAAVEVPYRVGYFPSDFNKSDLYRNVLPLLVAGQARLLKSKRLKTQLTGLDRFSARGGRDTVDHAPGAHDDVANVAAGALMRADRQRLRPSAVPDPPPKDLADKLKQDMWKGVRAEREPPAAAPNRYARHRRR